MELLFLLLLVPVVWLMLLPSRIAGTVKRYRFAAAGVMAVAALGGFLMLSLNHPADAPADYAQGDAALRAMLE
jgi:hypothetical protein